MTFRDPRFVIAMSVIVLFAGAYAWHPDATMNGALIAGFNIAIGYYLGSSSGAAKSADNAGKALDLAAAGPNGPIKPDVTLAPGQTAQADPAP